MPNWCENDLQVSGEDRRVREFLELAGTEGTAIDFNRFVPYPAEFAERDRAAEAWRNTHPPAEWFSGPTDGFNSGGYDWRVKHWGTKWSARGAARGEGSVEGSTATVVLHFDTAWSPPTPVVLNASRRFPDLTFDLRWYECGMGLQGRYECRGGEVVSDETCDYSGPRGG